MDVGFKHLVTCRCVLPQLQSDANPPLHQFVVFSVMDDDKVVPKHVQCNCCGVVHRITDVCQSEIVKGRDELPSVLTVDEIKMGLHDQLVAILEKNDADIATWEHVKWICENERWGEFVVLTTEVIDGFKHVKYLRLLGKSLFQVNNHSENVYIQNR